MSSRFNKVLGAGLIAGLLVAAGMVGQSLAGEVADAGSSTINRGAHPDSKFGTKMQSSA